MSQFMSSTPRRSAGFADSPTRRAHSTAARSAGFAGTSSARRAGLAAVAGLVTVGVAAPAANALPLAPVSTPTSTTQVAPVPATRYTTVALNVRAEANPSAKLVTTLVAGTKVSTTGITTEGWSQIDHAGTKRWVATQYLSTTAPAAASRTASASRSISRPALTTAAVSTSGVSAKRATVLKAAYQGIGGSYVWGGTKFGAWDCSGFVLWATGQAGINLPRTASAQAGALTRTSNPQPGDLVLQNGGGHIGIYVGNGKMISALNPSSGTKLHSVSTMPVVGYYTYS